MAIGTPYHLGSAAPTASGNTTVVTAGQASGAGDAIIVCTGTTGTTTLVNSITDTKSNTYSPVQRYNAGSFTAETWIAEGAAALTTSDTITAFWSGNGTTHRMDVMGCSGIAASGALDPSGVATANNAGSTSPSTGATGTLANTGELAIATCVYGSGGGTIAWGNSYTSMASVQAGGTEFLTTAYKSLATTSGTTASGTITSAPWTIMVVVFTGVASSAPVVWYDGTYAGWQSMQANGITDPSMFAYGPAWTSTQLATLPSDTIQMPLDDTGGSPHKTTVIDVENGDVTTASAIASWINSRLALPGGYAANRPTVYLNTSGSYYLNAANDVITPLASTYGLHLGTHYDLWAANRTGTQPAGPVITLGVPCVATQYQSYAQTGHQYDVNITFDPTWTAAFSGASPAVPANLFSVITTAADPTESLTGSPPVVITGGGAGPSPIGWPQLFVEIALPGAQPVVKLGTFILDDPVYGVLGGGRLGDSSNWTDITAYVISIDANRPSTRVQGPLLTYQAATAAIVLDNSDGRFDPDNANGPYVINGVGLHAMIPLRIRAESGSTESFLFSGFTDGWEPSLVSYEGGYAELTVNATDGFKVLNGVTLAALTTPVGAGETSGARISRILNAAGWYTDHRKIATGDTSVQATSFGDTAMNLLQLTADTEIGELYISGAGYLTFRNRHAILSETRSTTVQALFGDLPGTAH